MGCHVSSASSRRIGVGGLDQQGSVLGSDESRVDRTVEERDERREVAVVVEQARGLRVQAELVPRRAPRTARRACRSRRAARSPRRTGRTSAPCACASCRRCAAAVPACATSRSTMCFGITPMTSPPAASTSSASTPISPTEPPPNTTPWPRLTSVCASSRASVGHRGIVARTAAAEHAEPHVRRLTARRRGGR